MSDAEREELHRLLATLGEWKGNTLSWEAHIKRRKNLADGMRQLLREAFDQ